MPNSLPFFTSFIGINLLLLKFIQLKVNKRIGNILYRLKSIYERFQRSFKERLRKLVFLLLLVNKSEVFQGVDGRVVVKPVFFNVNSCRLVILDFRLLIFPQLQVGIPHGLPDLGHLLILLGLLIKVEGFLQVADGQFGLIAFIQAPSQVVVALGCILASLEAFFLCCADVLYFHLDFQSGFEALERVLLVLHLLVDVTERCYDFDNRDVILLVEHVPKTKDFLEAFSSIFQLPSPEVNNTHLKQGIYKTDMIDAHDL